LASLSIRNLTKTFGEGKVVDDVSIDVGDGEFVVLVGPSGCGKSTTLRMVAGLEGIDGGSIAIAGREVNELHPADRDIAMVFQSYALYPHMNVYDNIAYGLRRRSVPRAEIDERVSRVAALLKLDALLQRRPAQLSGGQRQRVALGRAIVRQPSVFLMDEPLSNLDAKLRVEMRAELTRLHADLGVTTVYVTHDQVEAMTMGSRIVVMNAGRIEQIGTPLDIYARPASLFVARFLGLPEINLVEGSIAADGRSFASPDLRLTLPEPGTPGAVVLGLRPQALVGVAEGSGDGQSLGEAGITAIEHHGPESFATCRLGGTALIVRVAPAADLHIGSRIRLFADVSAPHLFDPATGRRLADGATPAAGAHP
jgi:ABC-type sugar transport system ATPase subunit